MIIVDLSQVFISNIMAQVGFSKDKVTVDENICRHMILNSLRSYKQKYSYEYGEMVIACDNGNYWRKKLFPYYKAIRKKTIEDSNLDWKVIFEILSKIRKEIKEHFSYRVIDIDTAEADDVIAILCKEFSNTGDRILILSGDKDFIQLQKYSNVTQYDPVRKKFITGNPKEFLKNHILNGDKGDGIPNILSDDNCFVVGTRQKSMTEKRLKELNDVDMETQHDHPNYRNYKRNQQLIDLSFVPVDVECKIIENFHFQKDKKPKDLMNYFINHRLKNLMADIGDFL